MVIDKYRVLVIDDTEVQRFIVRAILEELEGIIIDEAESGIKGLEKLSEHRYAAILLDIEMPGMLGYDVARAIKFTEKNANTPIIIITAHSEDKEIINKAYECGATDFITKPLRPLILKSKIQQFAQLHLSQQRALYLKQENDLILNAASHGVIKLDMNGKIIYANSMSNIMLSQKKSLVGSFFNEWFKEAFILEENTIFDYLFNLFNNQDACNLSNINILNKLGNHIPVELSCTSVVNKGSLEIIIFFQNISERLEAEKKLIKLANFDHLTQLGNRANYTSSLKRAHAYSLRYNTNFALVMLDLDKFKNINDTLGHDIGDAVLVEFSSRLQKNIRESDTIVRLGGDEFAVILEGINSEEKTHDKVCHLQSQLSSPCIINGKSIPIESSIGIAFCHQGEPDITSLQKWADLALYAAKDAGRNTVKTYEPLMSEELNLKTSIETKLRNGISNNEFVVYYQPKVSTASNLIIGFEALLRWPQKKGEPQLSPANFIPIAEESGLVPELTRIVLKTCCKLMHEWNLDERKQKLTLSVNLSACELNNPMHIKELCDVVSSYTFDKTRLYFEITETSLLADTESCNNSMQMINKLGCKLSLDDFGTGYSSLKHIQSLPIDEIKIDRSFVLQSNQQRMRMLMKAIIGLAQTFNLNIVAEGIETKEQLNHMKALGCSCYQGFYFSEAVAKADIDKVIEAINQR
ncbi:MAG: EAL domain-containing protein, partial [Sinobacterium sp.]|nr:EAL domain-containing protein [Sinobacterium sp.]